MSDVPSDASEAPNADAPVSEASVYARMLSATDLGGPGPAEPTFCSIAAVEVLTATVGAGARLTSIQLEVSSKPVGSDDVLVRTRIDKRTRSIAFASVEATAGAELIFRAQALFGLQKET